MADYPVLSSKSYVSPYVMTLFRESDKTVYERKRSDRNPIEWGHADPEDDAVETVVEYRALASQVRQRLDILGFTLARVKKEFEEVKAVEIQKLKEWSDENDYRL